jgi:signal peptidase I
MNKKVIPMIKELYPYLIIIVLVLLIRTFLVTPIKVSGHSMDNTLQNREILILKKYDKNIKRFDIVVIDINGEKIIKRVIGLPGDKILYKNNKLYINGTYYKEPFLVKGTITEDYKLDSTIPKGYYFVLGDNRANSADSRIIGLISKKEISGKTDFALFPFNRFGKI